MMTEVSAIEDLEQRGFTLNFSAERGGLRCAETGELLPPEELTIFAVRRFEGSSDTDDESVIYAVESANGARGLVVDAYGPYGSPELAKLLEKIHIEPAARRL